MKKSGLSLILTASLPILLALAVSGCATKKYVAKQTGVVNQRVSQVQNQTNAQLAKQQKEISRLDERVITTDSKLAAVANTAQQANATAGQAQQQAQANSAAIETNTTQIGEHAATLVKLAGEFNYTVIETGNVTFAFGRSDLTNDAKVALDLMIQKAKATPRAVVEVVGFTDDIGPKSYNLTLSRRRAEAVARYLVQQNIPLKGISLLGLGEEATPEVLAAEFQSLDPNASKKELRTLARRVRIRLYAPGAGAASAQLQP